MLVLSRKNDESVFVGADDCLGGRLKVKVLEIGNGRVRLGFEANKAVPVYREEVWERICGSRPLDPTTGSLNRAGSYNEIGSATVLSGTVKEPEIRAGLGMREARTAMDRTNSMNAGAGWSGPLACLPVSRSVRDVIESESVVRDASALMAWSADDAAANKRRAIQKAEYDTCSGDSCWVRQYLEWCDPAIAVPTEVGIGLVLAGVTRFHAR